MVPSNNLFGGLTKVILTLVIIGVLVGLVLSGSDLTNFITNSAKAQGIKNQNNLQAQKDELDIKNYQAIQETTTQIKIDQLKADSAAYQKSLEQGLQFQAQKSAQELEMARFISYAGTGIGLFIAFCIGIGAVILMIQTGRSRLILAQAQLRRTDPWQDSAWREEQIQIARQREQAMRRTNTQTASYSSVRLSLTDETPVTWEKLRQQYIGAKKR